MAVSAYSIVEIVVAGVEVARTELLVDVAAALERLLKEVAAGEVAVL